MHGISKFKEIVEGINKDRVLNLPISKSDFDNAERIWGKDMGSIVRRSTRMRPSPVKIEPTYISVDKEIILCIGYFLHWWTYLSVERESTPQHVYGVASCK